MRGSFVGEVDAGRARAHAARAPVVSRIAGPGIYAAALTIRAPVTFSLRTGIMPRRSGAPLEQRFIVRHRLIKQDSSLQRRRARRSSRFSTTSIEARPNRFARRWSRARAGGIRPFRPPVGRRALSASTCCPRAPIPMDARYNIIQWVHRFTRGWSYGHPVADPRTGEIIKGNVTLGSLRGPARLSDRRGAAVPYVSGKKISAARMIRCWPWHWRAPASWPLTKPATPWVWRTIRRQRISAHARPNRSRSWTTRILGLRWTRTGVPDLSAAYAVNIGVWDKVAINYGYRQFPDSAERSARTRRHIERRDASPACSTSPTRMRGRRAARIRIAHLWDNGPDAADELARIMKIRAAALGEVRRERDSRWARRWRNLEDTLAPLYLDASIPDRSGHQDNRRPGLSLPAARRRADECGHCFRPTSSERRCAPS